MAYLITLFVGLPGSGKSYYAEKMPGILLDDITDLEDLPKNLGSGDLNIVDVNFCDQQILDSAISVLYDDYPNHTIETKFFKNDPDQCRKNVAYRVQLGDDRNVEGTIARFSKFYSPPETSVDVWKSPTIQE